MKKLSRASAKRGFRIWASVLGMAAALLSSLVLAGQAGASLLPKPGVCHPVKLPVALAQGQTADQTVAGTLCTPLYWHAGQHRIDVLVHGATYNSSYWDFPYNNAQYSYVNDTLLAGRATFAYDDVGTGASSHPPSAGLTFLGDAYILHQLISWVHGQGYQKVDVIAHSKGSAVAIDEAGTYQDISALVVTGLLHRISDAGNAAAANDFYPANQDPAPQFAGLNLDDGYYTTRPGTRGAVFYSSIADPGVIAYDELHKDDFAWNQFSQSFPIVFAPAASNISNSITVPILTVEGQQDLLFCGAGGVDCSSAASVKAVEAPYYQHAADYDVQVVPKTGHDLTLHPTSLLSFAGIDAWLDQH